MDALDSRSFKARLSALRFSVMVPLRVWLDFGEGFLKAFGALLVWMSSLATKS